MNGNVNIGPNAIVGRVFNPALNEHAPVGTVAAVVSQIVDADDADVYTFSLQDDANGAFDILGDGSITVRDPNEIDFENDASKTVTVRITDPVTGFHDEDVAISLFNLAEPAQSLPGAQVIDEDGTLVFSGLAVPIVSDTLADTDTPLQVALAVDDGVLNLPQLTGIDIVGGAQHSAAITINGMPMASMRTGRLCWARRLHETCFPGQIRWASGSR